MDRKIEQRFLQWKAQHTDKALVVTGARKVGKTYSIRRFVSDNYRNHVYINFEDDPLKIGLFDDDTTADAIFERLSFEYQVDFDDGCALILDEIQLCPRAVSALKPLAIDGRCDVLASGSLLGNMASDSILSPMGYTDEIVMEPMDFEEFLWAMGITATHTASIGERIRGMKPLDDYISRMITDLFKRYIVVGGMPEAVKTYAMTRDYTKVSEIHRGIYDRMCDDAWKYAPRRADRLRIRECLDSIPMQLSNDKKVFNYSDILMRRGYGRREYGSSLLWLKNAGIIDVVHNLEEPAEPLRTRSRADSFRVYMKDTGILTYMLGPNIASGIVNGDFYVDDGAILKNAVAESLIRKGYEIYFYRREKKKDEEGRTFREGMELDFVTNMNGELTAIEVKSGRKTKSKSLTKAMGPTYEFDRGIKLADDGIMTDDMGIEHYPLFAVSFMEECRPPDLGPMDYTDGLKQALDSLRSDLSGRALPSWP